MSESLNLSFKNITTTALPFIFQDVNTTPFSHNYLAAYSPAAAEYIALPKTINKHPDFVKIFSGELLPKGGDIQHKYMPAINLATLCHN